MKARVHVRRSSKRPLHHGDGAEDMRKGRGAPPSRKPFGQSMAACYAAGVGDFDQVWCAEPARHTAHGTRHRQASLCDEAIEIVGL